MLQETTALKRMAPSLSRTLVALLAALSMATQGSAWLAPGARGGMARRSGSSSSSASSSWRGGVAKAKATARVVVVRAEDEREGEVDGEMVEYKGERLATTTETLTATGE